MSNETTISTVPKLRFPEFEGAVEWETELFKEIYSFKGTNSLSRDKLNYEGGAVKNIHYGDIHTKFATLFDITKEKVPFINASIALDKVKEENYCVEGDIILADASEDMDDIGKSIEVVNLNGEKVLSGLHTQFARQKAQKLVIGFAGHLFKSGAMRAQIQNEAQGTKVLGISAGRLSKIEICYPGDKSEQQKIAATLSSLEDLLTAQSAKLAVLQAHKRGLMQGLFPAEGETVPKLRFPEFLDAEDWVEKTIGSICKTYSGGTPSTSRKDYYGGIIPFIRSAEIDKECTELFLTEDGLANSSAKLIGKGDILFALYGANSGDVAISKQIGAINQAILCIKSEASNVFIFHFLTYRKDWIIKKYLQGGQGNLSGEIVKSIDILIPSPAEQQKIADCLSSLDNRISAQHQQIEALKLHKKGLMQGLFPAAAEPTA